MELKVQDDVPAVNASCADLVAVSGQDQSRADPEVLCGTWAGHHRPLQTMLVARMWAESVPWMQCQLRSLELAGWKLPRDSRFVRLNEDCYSVN